MCSSCSLIENQFACSRCATEDWGGGRSQTCWIFEVEEQYNSENCVSSPQEYDTEDSVYSPQENDSEDSLYSSEYDSEESVTVPVAYNNNSPGHNIYNLYIYVPEAY